LQWPRDLGHELSSLTQSVGSWVRITLRLRLFCVQIAVFDWLVPNPRSPIDYVKRSRNRKAARVQQRAVSHRGLLVKLFLGLIRDRAMQTYGREKI
jgi:hypothetical protein